VTLARSTDDGKTFQNYAWSSEQFEADGVFFGDYTGLAAFGGRVYGVWMEKPSSPPKVETKPGDKAAAEEKKSLATVVKVGVADFGTGIEKK
jgi:hypothetical protein